MSTEQEIIAQNKVIAEFIGWEFREVEMGIEFWKGSELRFMESKEYLPRHLQALSYHSSFDSLMPVIIKISEVIDIADPGIEDKYYTYPVTFGMKDSEGNFMLRFYGFGLHHGKTLIEAAYNAVIEIIEWYNKQKQETT